MKEKLYTVEYSCRQGCFQIDTLENTLVVNRSNIAAGRDPPYSIIALCDSYEAAEKFICEWKNGKVLKKRE